MPKRTDIKSILIIGAGPIVIGQACEFDYSGAQACKALRSEGYRVILVNSNPATIMTDPEMADVTYIEPITWEVVERIIAKEKPDAILLDAMMPELDGIQTIAKLQSNPETKNIPTIFITAKAQASDRRRFYNAGAKGVINKPFDSLTLASQISGFLGW